MIRWLPLELAVWPAAVFLVASLFSGTVALRLVALGLGTLLVGAELARRRFALTEHFRALPSIALPFALWAAWAVASLAWSEEFDRTQKELRNEVLYSFLALFLCHSAAQARSSGRVILPSLALGAVAVCGIALFEFWTLPFSQYLLGVHGGPGAHSSTLLVLMPCSLALAWLPHTSPLPAAVRAIAWALPPIYLAAAATTLNRTIWLAFAVQVVVMGALAVMQGAGRTRRAMLTFGACAAVVLALGIALSQLTLATRLASAGDVFGQPADGQDPRVKIWAFVLDEVREQPWLGTGFGRGLLREDLQAKFGDNKLWHAHNLFLDMLLQLGMPGLALLVLLIAATLREGWRLARSPDAVARACGIALVAVVAGMVMRNMTDTLLVRQNALLYWGAVGLLLGWGTCRTSSRVQKAG